jgi:hypothetical protein
MELTYAYLHAIFLFTLLKHIGLDNFSRAGFEDFSQIVHRHSSCMEADGTRYLKVIYFWLVELEFLLTK